MSRSIRETPESRVEESLSKGRSRSGCFSSRFREIPDAQARSRPRNDQDYGHSEYEICSPLYADLHTYPLVLDQGTRLFPDTGPDKALELIESRSTPGGVIIQVYRPNGRP
jgi:hypothetical protein